MHGSGLLDSTAVHGESLVIRLWGCAFQRQERALAERPGPVAKTKCYAEEQVLSVIRVTLVWGKGDVGTSVPELWFFSATLAGLAGIVLLFA